MAPEISSAEDFGANDWLIDEMYERYQSDADSVDPSWVTWFEKRDGEAADEQAPRPVGTTAATEQAPRGETPKDPGYQDPQEAARMPEQATVAPQGPVQPKPLPADAPVNPAVEQAVASNKPAEALAAAAKAKVPAAAAAKAPASAAPVAKALAKAETAPAKQDLRKKTILKGAAMRTARNMEGSVAVPTATTVRAVPMKLVIESRTDINNHLKRNRGGKISFTHLIAYAMVQAIKAVPAMNNTFADEEGKAVLIESGAVNLGIAIDVKRPDGGRALVVPNIRNAEGMDFAQFWAAYEVLVHKGRTNTLTVDDFAGTTASLTNPGGIGTNHSMARLMNGQSVILGVGNVDYPAEFSGTAPERLDELAISKITTFTSTYDHRVIQGAQSGEFLKKLHELLTGGDGFYDSVYESLRIPYPPFRWATDAAENHGTVSKASKVLALIDAYRSFGHLASAIDPLAYSRRHYAELDLEAHGLSIWDLDRAFPVGSFAGSGRPLMKLRDILEVLRDGYCRFIAVEYMHIPSLEQRQWFQDRVERQHETPGRKEQLRILDRLNEAEIFETFLQTKFVGQKRFSLEGGESAIVCLDKICEAAATNGLEEVCIGMPHRGRLNVLTNIVGKSYGQVFREFDESLHFEGTGDVKYHLGAEGEFTTGTGETVRTSVAANPSHLEAVSPVLAGIARAKQDMSGRDDHPILAVLLHGDASFSGQGVNFETLQMSQLRAFSTGGTIHLVVNNQVGFTTSPTDSRSSTYCTDIAKSINAPVFHVNGDQPEAVAHVAQLAFDYRRQFGRDVVIDLVCYRRRGHNEGDDPSFTQPLMYDLIEAKRSVRKLYTEALIGRGDISIEDAEGVQQRFRERLEKVFAEVRQQEVAADNDYTRVPYYPEKKAGPGETAISQELMQAIADAQVAFPEGFQVHPKVRPQLQRRATSILEGPIDWATAELLALGSLAVEGRPVRLTGQDARRGTFVQRFAAAVDRETGEAWLPLAHVTDDQASFEVYDSLLSEYAVLGFEYGYSVARPDAIVLWEAQFGDFVNGAQTIADEFIASGRAKWGQNSGIVLLLPHGYEGQGPDHSSARIERWLQLCSEDALAVCQPSTPASYFHLLRTHAYVNWHRPVVIATPKSMLRNKLAVSPQAHFTDEKWRPALADPTITDASAVRRLVLCSGKVRWDLVAEREKLGKEGEVAIVSLERLYPLPTAELVAELEKYRHVTDVRWVQDEPENQGPWSFLALNLPHAVAEAMPGYELTMQLVSRPRASAPSVGSHHVHDEQQKDLLARALGD